MLCLEHIYGAAPGGSAFMPCSNISSDSLQWQEGKIIQWKPISSAIITYSNVLLKSKCKKNIRIHVVPGNIKGLTLKLGLSLINILVFLSQRRMSPVVVSITKKMPMERIRYGI